MDINIQVTLIYRLEFTKFHNNKLRAVPLGAVRKVRLVHKFITCTNVPYYFPKTGAYCTVLAYHTVLPSLIITKVRSLTN